MTGALYELEQAFLNWRSQKKSKRDRIPAELLERARELSQSFSEREICKATRIPASRLFPRSTERASGFVELPGAMGFDLQQRIAVEIRKEDRTLTVQLPGATPLGYLFSSL